MKSINEIAEILSNQIELAGQGKANPAQADIVCKATDTLIRLARLQLETSEIDWDQSDEMPVIAAQPKLQQITQGANGSDNNPALFRRFNEDLSGLTEAELKEEVKVHETELSHLENKMDEYEPKRGSKWTSMDNQAKTLRAYILALRDEIEER